MKYMLLCVVMMVCLCSFNYGQWTDVEELVYAAREGDINVVRSLIKKGTNINGRSENQQSAFMIGGIGRHTALIEAIENSNLEIVRELLRAKADVNVQDKDGDTALFRALHLQDLDLIKELITAGAKLNLKNHSGDTVLHWAASGDSVEIIKLLIQEGADVNVRNNQGETPLHSTCGHCSLPNFEIVKMLIDAGANVQIRDNNGIIPLHYAIGIGNKECSKQNGRLEFYTMLINNADLLNLQDNEGNAALHYAARNTEIPLELVKEFIKSGANFQLKNKDGLTPYGLATMWKNKNMETLLKDAGAVLTEEDKLGIASMENDIDTIRVLIKQGVNINVKDTDGKTLLMKAIVNGQIEYVKEFIGANAELEIRDNEGATSLHYAVKENKLEIVQELIKAGADVNAKDNLGQTVLFIINRDTDARIVRALLKTDIDVNSTCAYGCNALPFIVTFKNTKIVKDLITAGIDVNSKCDDGLTALHMVIDSDSESIEMVRLLIKAGAYVNVTDESGESPLFSAISIKNTKLVQILRNAGAKYDKKIKYLFYSPENKLLHAAETGNIKAVNNLIKMGVHLNVRNQYDFTALMLAVINKHSNIAIALIKAGASVHTLHKESDGLHGVSGASVLHWAAQNNSIDVVRELIKAGADVNAKSAEFNDIGPNVTRTPLFFAATNHNPAIAEELIKAGALINISDECCKPAFQKAKEEDVQNNKDEEEGETPLYYAVVSNNTAVVKLLIKAGANVNAKSCIYNDYPLHQALASQNIEIIIELINAGAGATIGARNRLLQSPLDIAMGMRNGVIMRLFLMLMIPKISL